MKFPSIDGNIPPHPAFGCLIKGSHPFARTAAVSINAEKLSFFRFFKSASAMAKGQEKEVPDILCSFPVNGWITGTDSPQYMASTSLPSLEKPEEKKLSVRGSKLLRRSKGNMKILLIALCLLSVGCATRNIDGSPDSDSRWAHYVLPGYTTYDALHDRRESILVENARSYFPYGSAYTEEDFTGILKDPITVGIDIPTVWDALKKGNYHLVLSILWDAVKGAAWVYGINELSSSSADSGRSDVIEPDDGSSIIVFGARNRVYTEADPSSSSVVVAGDFNYISTVGFSD